MSKSAAASSALRSENAALKAQLEALQAQLATRPTPNAGINTGQFWGLRVTPFQNALFGWNAEGMLTPDPKGTESFTYQDAKGKTVEVKCRRVYLTDLQMAAVCNAEFPHSRATIGLHHIAAIRRVYNMGRHGLVQTSVPTVPNVERNAAGEPVTAKPGRRTAQPVQPVAVVPPPAPAIVPGKVKLVKKEKVA